jgi:hypothetical protein
VLKSFPLQKAQALRLMGRSLSWKHSPLQSRHEKSSERSSVRRPTYIRRDPNRPIARYHQDRSGKMAALLPHTPGHGPGVDVVKTTAVKVWPGPTFRYQEHKDNYETDRLPIEAFVELAHSDRPSR